MNAYRLKQLLGQESGTELGVNTKRFLKGLGVVGSYVFLARALGAAMQAIAGHWLGPQEFGLATIAVSASWALLTPLKLGFPNAVIKFAAMQDSQEGQAGVISTALWMNILWAGPCLIVLCLFRRQFSDALHIEPRIYGWSLLYALAVLVSTQLSSSLQGVMRFQERGRTELVYGIAAFLIFVAWARLQMDYRSFVGSMCAALALSAGLCVAYLRPWLRPTISKAAIKPILSYSLAPLMSAVAASAIQAAPPLVLAAHFSPREVGYFGAYEMGSMGVSLALLLILYAVLAPMTSSPDRQPGAWRRFFLYCAPLASALVLFFGLTQVLLLKLVGKAYPVDLRWLALFSLAATLNLLSNAALTMLDSLSAEGLWLGRMGIVIAAAGCLAGNFWAVPRFGVSGTAMGFIIGYGAALAWGAFWGWRKVMRIS